MRGKKIILCVGYISIAVVFAISIVLLFYSRNKNESGKAKRTIGASYMTMNNPYFEVINEEIKAVVENKGDVLETRDSAMDAEVQAEQSAAILRGRIKLLPVRISTHLRRRSKRITMWSRMGKAVMETAGIKPLDSK